MDTFDSCYKPIPILPVARACNLTLRHENHTEVEARCPFCGDRRYRLYLNTELNTFFCHNCEARGNSITLYANLYLGNDDYKAAYRVLSQDKIITFPSAHIPSPNRTPEPPIKPLAARHDAYFDFLSMLSLTPMHWNNLTGRGLSAEAITALLYKSVPYGREAQCVVAALATKHDLNGIPGFYTKDDDSWHMMERRGLFIPLCDKAGYIQGLQIRLDNVADRKFRLFSSRHEANGSRAYPYFHVTGNTALREAFLLEGAMKSDIVNYFTEGKHLFIAQAGAGNQKGLIDLLKSMSINRVYLAYDMDRLRNPHVKKHADSMMDKLTQAGITFRSCVWDAAFNGMDDYAHHLFKSKVA